MSKEVWSPEDYLAYVTSGKKKADRTKCGAKAKARMHWLLVDFARRYDLILAQDYRFHPTRKWEADWALFGQIGKREIRLIIEYEGTISDKARHTTIKGYSGDCRKYNAAAVLGWIPLRYTALTFEDMGNDLQSILNNKGDAA